MKKEEYFKISKKEGLPSRCPILNYCMRRLITIYFFSDYSRFDKTNDIIKYLKSKGYIPNDFDLKKVGIQGEAPEFGKSDNLMSFENMCPEVSLFDRVHTFQDTFGSACTDGEWDNFRKDNKFECWNYKHYSECSEYSHYLSLSNLQKKRPKSINNRNRISKTLRFEIFQRDNFTCQYCGKSKNDGAILEIDHRIPISEGGKDDFNNLITSCKECNIGKSNKII